MYEFWEGVGWNGLAAIFAGASAIFAACQIWNDRIWRKRDRTFGHSPYRSEIFLESWEQLKKDYPAFAEQVLEDVSANPLPKEKVSSVVICANLFGQMATEYDYGMLDTKIADTVLKRNFVRFCQYFHPWLSDSKRSELYSYTLKLYDKWK